MVRNISFYNGGFQAKYGDKMSSVLDIHYKKPAKFAGSVYVSLLEQGAYTEGSSANKKFSYLAGVRNKSNQSLLSNQPTQGAYIPSASDAQALVTYKFTERWQAEVLGIFSSSRFTFYPESVQKTASVFSPFYTSNIGLDVFFEGQEKDKYTSSLLGISIIQNPNKVIKLKWMASRFKDDENENFDIAGAYLFGERDFDKASNSFGQIVNPLGSGYYQDYARNKLNIELWNFSHKGSWDIDNHFFQWGFSYEQSKINDVLKQWQFRDSAGYSLPYTPGIMTLFSNWNSSANLNINRFNGYVQDNMHFQLKNADISLQAGIRFNFNNLLQAFIISRHFTGSSGNMMAP